jgi:serine/threonine protein kinase
VDWWALGVLLYEMVIGQPPFDGKDEDELFESILYDDIRFPTWIGESAKAAILGFLTRPVGKRLGVGKAGSRSGDDILHHSFFSSMEWAKIDKKELPPPFLPKVKADPHDASNFHPEFTKAVPQLTPTPADQLKIINQDDFEGFSFVNQDLMKK